MCISARVLLLGSGLGLGCNYAQFTVIITLSTYNKGAIKLGVTNIKCQV